VLGRQSVMFWSILGGLLSAVWGSLCNKPGDFNLFMGSRAFAGLFGSVVAVLGPRCIRKS
jgi:hypothetical protein